MKKLKLVISKRVDPVFNIKMDEKMLMLVGNGTFDESVRFYKNRDAVILGRNQCEELEVNKDYCKKNSIAVLRRISGGGAVFHDLGNLNVAVYIRKESMPSPFIVESMIIFSNAVKQALNSLKVPAEVGLHGEILVNGRKISGCASAKKFNGFLYHATLLLNSDTKKLYRALTPKSTVKVKKKYVRSNRAVVVNLFDVVRIPESVLIHAVYRSFQSVFV